MPIKTYHSLLSSLQISFQSAGTLWSNIVSHNISNAMGYVTGILKVVASDDVDEISLGWRPIFDYSAPDPGPAGFLPVFMIKQGYDPEVASTPPVGVPPTYLLASNLTGGDDGDLEEGNLYYIFLGPPETPAAMPLIPDQDTTNHGIQLIAKGTGAASSSLDLKIRLFYTEFPNT